MDEKQKYVGITFDKFTGLWRVRVYKDRRTYFVGRYKDKEQALEAKLKFLKEKEEKNQAESSYIPQVTTPSENTTAV